MDNIYCIYDVDTNEIQIMLRAESIEQAAQWAEDDCLAVIRWIRPEGVQLGPVETYAVWHITKADNGVERLVDQGWRVEVGVDKFLHAEGEK